MMICIQTTAERRAGRAARRPSPACRPRAPRRADATAKTRTRSRRTRSGDSTNRNRKVENTSASVYQHLVYAIVLGWTLETGDFWPLLGGMTPVAPCDRLPPGRTRALSGFSNSAPVGCRTPMMLNEPLGACVVRGGLVHPRIDTLLRACQVSSVELPSRPTSPNLRRDDVQSHPAAASGFILESFEPPGCDQGLHDAPSITAPPPSRQPWIRQ